MPKSKSLPDHALVVRTYADLAQFAKAFAEGHLNLLFVSGAAGLGKSQHIRRAIGDSASWIDGNATAFGLYLWAYQHRDQPIVLDDIDGLYRDRSGVRLLKALCQTDRIKSVSWQSDARTLERRKIPHQFKTSSRVVIIANQWQTINPDVAALEDRGHFLSFEPPAVEIHREAATWFWDQSVFDFIAHHLHLMQRHSLRTYVLGWELKSAGLDWQRGILSRCLTGTALTVAQLKADPSFPSEEARVEAFVASGAGCRATYFNHARRLQAKESAPDLKLTHTTPPAPSAKPTIDVLDLLRRRFGELGNG